MNIGELLLKAERELWIPTREPDTDNAGVGNIFTYRNIFTYNSTVYAIGDYPEGLIPDFLMQGEIN